VESEVKTWDHAAVLQDAIQGVVNQEGETHGVVTAFILVAEVMDGDGKKLVSYRGPSSDAAPMWLVKGMAREVVDDPDSFYGEDDE
jgi:hypothetical protein